MAEKFHLDNHLMRHVTTRLADIGGDFAASSKKLTRTLDQYEGCWGEDDIGKAFDKQYSDNAGKLLDIHKQDGKYLTEAAENAGKSADNVDKVDTKTARKIDSKVPREKS